MKPSLKPHPFPVSYIRIRLQPEDKNLNQLERDDYQGWEM